MQIETGASPQSAAPCAALEIHRKPEPFFAFGLSIRSELELPEFRAGFSGAHPATVDVEIAFAPQPSCLEEIRGLKPPLDVKRDIARFWFENVGAFEVTAGSCIRISPEPGISDALLRMYVEGMMMATILFQRNYLVLHASVARIGAKGIGFIGHIGSGKSSTVAALHARGHAVVTDDNAAIHSDSGSPTVLPAFPFVKVFPSVARTIGYSDDSLTQMHDSQPKFVRRLERFADTPVPLDRIYVLSRETDRDIEQLTPAAATIEFVRNSAPVRWRVSADPAHLRQCAALAARIPVYRIRTFHQLTEIPSLASRIENHVA
jgi:hypothetical protein